MKQIRSTTPRIRQLVTTSTLVAGAVVMVLGAPINVYADVFDEKIRELQGQIDNYQGAASDLARQADTLQNAIARLDAQKASIQARINVSQAKHAQLVKKIADNEKRLKMQKQALADTLGDIYTDGTPSTIEILASSSTISDYIEKQEYRDSMNDRIERSIVEIKDLKKQLADQKADVERVLADQKRQRSDLVAKQNERAELLAVTRGKEAAYQDRIRSANAEISDLQAQQRAANAALGGNVVAGDPGKGGYPDVWANAPKDSLVDDWGMYNRECVSYTAWKVHQAGKHMPYWGGRGNANEWPSSARADGIPTGSTPRKGSVAISMSGYYGHAMWVEQVSGSQIYVSQYNYDLAGSYSEMWVDGSNFIYIYF